MTFRGEEDFSCKHFQGLYDKGVYAFEEKKGIRRERKEKEEEMGEKDKEEGGGGRARVGER